MSFNHKWILAAVLIISGMLSGVAQAQVLVYKLEFERKKGVNYHPFEGGYFIAPLLGGEGSFLLTSTEDGRSYLGAAGGGRLFTAVDGSNARAVVSATTGAGTAYGAMVALGEINHTVSVSSKTYQFSAKVAKSLSGTAVSADDESEIEETSTVNNNIGSAGVSEFKLTLDETETRRINKDSLSLAQAYEYLELLLLRQGYVNGAPDDDDDDDDDDDEEVTTSTETSLRGTEMQVQDILNIDP